MPKRQSNAKSSTAPEITRYQAFAPRTVRRSEIKGAVYNPRAIDKSARKRLRESVKEGPVETLVWNRQTGNLVGGHQRLDILDELEKYPGDGKDYSLTVAEIDVDEATEKQINVRLNNPGLQGAFDAEKLDAVLKELMAMDVSPEAMGFDAAELQMTFPDDPAYGQHFAAAKDKGAGDAVALDGMHQGCKEEMRKKRAKHKGKDRLLDDTEFYLVLVGRDRAEVDAFLDAVSVPRTERYLSLEKVAALVGIPLRTDPAGHGPGMVEPAAADPLGATQTDPLGTDNSPV